MAAVSTHCTNMLYAVRIGRTITREGPVTIYGGFPADLGDNGGKPTNIVSGRTDEEGLRELAQASKEPLVCTRDLEAAGNRLGVRAARLPKVLLPAVARAAIVLVHGALHSVEMTLSGFMEFCLAARAFKSSAPWRLWNMDVPIDVEVEYLGGQRRLEASLLGNRGAPEGLWLFDDSGDFERAMAACHDGDMETLERIDKLGMSFALEETGADQWLQRAFGLERAPYFMRWRNGEVYPVTTEDLDTISATLLTLSRLTASRREAFGLVCLDGRVTTALATAPPATTS